MTHFSHFLRNRNVLWIYQFLSNSWEIKSWKILEETYEQILRNTNYRRMDKAWIYKTLPVTTGCQVISEFFTMRSAFHTCLMKKNTHCTQTEIRRSLECMNRGYLNFLNQFLISFDGGKSFWPLWFISIFEPQLKGENKSFAFRDNLFLTLSIFRKCRGCCKINSVNSGSNYVWIMFWKSSFPNRHLPAQS